MSQLLKKGLKVIGDISQSTYIVDDYLGGGGQGEVYRVRFADKSYALKWYFPDSATNEQRNNLERLVSIGAPSDCFLWPIELTSSEESSDFGYIMPLRDSCYKSLIDLMNRRIDTNFRSICVAGRELAHNFLQLHARGLSYRDISFGNVFFDPQNGNILICDNDNVGPDNDAGVFIDGTPRFMAPEIVRGEAAPSTQTDLFSLAVLLFYLLIFNHPLEGQKEADIKCFDLPAQRKIYGSDPIFIYDPHNDTNRPVTGYHDNAYVFWPIYPEFIRDMFIRSFTEGIRDPQNGRVRESEWRLAMARLHDSIVYCSACGCQIFYDSVLVKSSKKAIQKCWSCKNVTTLPFRIKINSNPIMLNYDSKLYPHHVDESSKFNYSAPVAIVNRHPKHPDIWGLKNVSQEKWIAVDNYGHSSEVKPDKSIRLVNGLKINFGKSNGEVRI